MSAESAREAVMEEMQEADALEQKVTEQTAEAVVEVQPERPDEQGGVTALPPNLSQREREEAVRAEHPAGEVFFHGSVEEVTEGEAEEIARRQLARSGLLRGQKVRVAD